MKLSDNTIHLSKGYGNILLGESFDSVIQLLGIPDEMSEDTFFVKSKSCQYDTYELVLTFEYHNEKQNYYLSNIEIANDKASLYEKKLFKMKKKKIFDFISSHIKEEPFIDEYFEDKVTIYDYPETGLSLYFFMDDELVSILVYTSELS